MWYDKMGVLAPFARLAAVEAAQGAHATLLRWGTMLKVVGVLIKLLARDHRIGLMNWYHGCVETTPPEQ